MANILTSSQKPNLADVGEMHALYRRGGKDRAPHVVYQAPTCAHPGCDQPMQAIDFRVEAYGRAIHDPLVVAWWNDTGFAGQCPRCRGWIHFTIRGQRPITAQEAAQLPKLPDDWHQKAIIL